MLCTTSPTCEKLQEEEVWSQQQSETKEEAEVEGDENGEDNIGTLEA